ncbi:MAG: hypothetical protein FWF91_06385 [Coriobacteriia bacterium]|nr:hypothetical protein [Coriobacteriia bacterium]
MAESARLICSHCGVMLVEAEVTLRYLGYEFKKSVPRCPECGEAYLDEALVRGQMAEVEQAVEDK